MVLPPLALSRRVRLRVQVAVALLFVSSASSMSSLGCRHRDLVLVAELTVRDDHGGRS